MPWIQLTTESLSFTAGTPVEYRSSPPVTRTFCGRCGTPLTYRATSYGDKIDVTTCSLDHPEAFPPTVHIWTSHKVEWSKLADDLPYFEEFPPTD